MREGEGGKRGGGGGGEMERCGSWCRLARKSGIGIVVLTLLLLTGGKSKIDKFSEQVMCERRKKKFISFYIYLFIYYYFLDFAFTGIGLAVLADVQFKSRSSADFDSHFAASQMRLREIQNAQVQRLRDRVIQELKQVLERIRLSLEEYYTTDAERVVESPDQDQKETQKREKRREPRRKTRKKMRAREKEKQQKKQDKEKLEQQEKQDLTGFEPGSLEQAKEQELTRKDINQQATVSNKENGDGVIPSETSDSSEDDEGGDGEENGEQSNDIDDEDNDVKEGGTARRQVSNTLLNRVRRKYLLLVTCLVRRFLV